MTPTKRAVLVLGMHRSGTSALTRVINLMGFAAPKTLMAATEANEAGFWESEVFMDLNETILKACDSNWYRRRPFQVDPLAVTRANGLYAKVRETLAAEYGGAELIVLKDPRISRLYPLYAEALRVEGYRISPVLALRNPVEVAASLTKRDEFTPGKGLGIWLRYTLDAERDTRGQPRAVIAFDDLMADWRGTMARAAAQLGEPWPVMTPQGETEADQSLRPKLRHHALAPPRATTWRGFLSRQAYDAMARLSTAPADAGACRTMDRIAAVFRPF